MTNIERVLRAGVDLTNRGELKYARAVHLFNELRGRIDEWSAAQTLLARIEQIDPHTLEFRLVVRRVAPVEEWSLVLGNALHNLRAVFDNVMWALATLDGAEPIKPTQVSFPLTETEADWMAWMRYLESVPPVFLNRIKALQPWVVNIPAGESFLGLLHQFDIVDKHRDLISGALHFKQLSTAGFDLHYEPEETSSTARPRYSTSQSPKRIEHNALLLTLSCDTHTINADPDYLAKVEVQFVLDLGKDRKLPLDKFVGDLVARTREWLDLIYGGELYAKSSKLARESSDASVTMGYEDEDGELHITRLPMAPYEPTIELK